MKTILITGGAKGIGFASAEKLLSQGWAVGLIDLDQKDLETAQSQLGGKNVYIAVADVTDSEALKKAFETIHSEAGKIDAVLNNAGILFGGDFQSVALSDYDRLIDVNIKGVVNTAYIAFEYLSSNPSKTHLINMSSASTFFGTPRIATYAAGKSFVTSLTEALSLEWEDHNIIVTSIEPPFTNTAMIQGDDNPVLDYIRIKGKNLNAETGTISADVIADYVAKAVKLTHSQRLYYSPGWDFKLLRILTEKLPKPLPRLLYKVFSQRR